MTAIRVMIIKSPSSTYHLYLAGCEQKCSAVIQASFTTAQFSSFLKPVLYTQKCLQHIQYEHSIYSKLRTAQAMGSVTQEH